MANFISSPLHCPRQVFTFAFLLEMVLKLTAFGPRGYVKSRWNLFDGFIVVISIFDLALELGNVGYGQGGGGGLSVLRTFRLVSHCDFNQPARTF